MSLVSAGGGVDGFVARYDAGGGLVWAQRFGGGGPDDGFDVAVDGSGNVFVVGLFDGWASFGVGVSQQTRVGVDDGFVAKFSPSGALLWVRTLSGPGRDVVAGVGVGADGGVVVSGSFEGSAVPSGGSALVSAGGPDGFVASYGPNGSLRWAQRLGGAAVDGAREVAFGAGGEVYVAGFFGGPAQFGSGAAQVTLPGNGAVADGFVARFTSAGQLGWVSGFGGATIDLGWDVVVDGNGDVAVVGGFTGTATFGSTGAPQQLVAPVGGSRGMTAWYSPVDGSLVRVEPLGDFVFGIDQRGGATYVAATFPGFDETGLLNPVPATSWVNERFIDYSGPGDQDGVVARISADHTMRWVRWSGGVQVDRAWGVAVAADGSIRVVGTFQGTATFGIGDDAQSLVSTGSDDVFVARMTG